MIVHLLELAGITVVSWAVLLPMLRDDRKPVLVAPRVLDDERVPLTTFDHTGLT